MANKQVKPNKFVFGLAVFTLVATFLPVIFITVEATKLTFGGKMGNATVSACVSSSDGRNRRRPACNLGFISDDRTQTSDDKGHPLLFEPKRGTVYRAIANKNGTVFLLSWQEIGLYLTLLSPLVLVCVLSGGYVRWCIREYRK